MGGHAAGEVASALTIEAIAESMVGFNDDTDTTDRLRTAFAEAQDRVVTRSSADDTCRGMGSCAIAGVKEGDALCVCHVGDVRAYHLSQGRLQLVTNDHSWVWEKLVMSGLTTPEQARNHPERGKITQAIGASHGIRPELNELRLKLGDRVLLCSDGLWEAIGDHEIRTVLASNGSMRHLASVLVDKANAAGGEDNITAVVYEHHH